MRIAAAALVLLAGCHAAVPVATQKATPGDGLERAALARGLVGDPAHADPGGIYARDGDRVCVVPAAGSFRIGALVRFDDGPGCEATGSARQRGSALDVRFGDGCRFAATFEGDRIAFPAMLPAGCERFCSGRASLAALAGERLSPAIAEAAALRDAHGRALCDAPS